MGAVYTVAVTYRHLDNEGHYTTTTREYSGFATNANDAKHEAVDAAYRRATCGIAVTATKIVKRRPIR